MKDGKLLDRLVHGVMHDLHEFQSNNTDYWRYQMSDSERTKSRLKERVLQLANQKGFVRKNFSTGEIAERFLSVLGQINELENFYGQLQDDYSRHLLVEVLKFRILDQRYARLPLNTDEFWETRDTLDTRFLKQRDTIKAGTWNLNQYKLDEAHGSIDVHNTSLGILTTFLLEQYAYRKSKPHIEVEAGDTVIDAGGCWGETSLYFAERAGATGRVYTFEFVPDNLEIFRRNMERNQSLAARVNIVEHPVWERSDETLMFDFNGPGTTLASGTNGNAVGFKTLTIDDLVRREELTDVDFIKMDIEGAELAALHGAEQTLREFKPKLAIALYHRDEDFVDVPNYLNQLELNYEFYLDHFTIYREETILFARPAAAAAP